MLLQHGRHSHVAARRSKFAMCLIAEIARASRKTATTEERQKSTRRSLLSGSSFIPLLHVFGRLRRRINLKQLRLMPLLEFPLSIFRWYSRIGNARDCGLQEVHNQPTGANAARPTCGFDYRIKNASVAIRCQQLQSLQTEGASNYGDSNHPLALRISQTERYSYQTEGQKMLQLSLVDNSDGTRLNWRQCCVSNKCEA
jgi:hypothetical protein